MRIIFSGLLVFSCALGAQEVTQNTQPPAAERQGCCADPSCAEKELYPAWGSLTPQVCKERIRAGIEIARKRLEKLRAIRPEEATYDNVFGAFENMADEMDEAEGQMHVLSSVMDSGELRAVQEELIPELSRFSTSVTSDAGLWKVIKAAAAAPWVKDLSPEKQRYVQQVVDTFHDRGADLPDDKKARYAEIVSELSSLAHEFGKNVLDATNAWQWVVDDPSQLAGMSEDWMSRAASAAQQKGFGSAKDPRWLITLQEPSVYQVIFHCNVEATRKRCWEALSSIGKGAPYDNAAIVIRVMKLRQELANLLGFKNYPDLVLAHRMVGSGDKAMSFVDDMMRKVKAPYDAEARELLEFIAKDKGQPVQTKINPWDTAYYLRKLQKEKFSFDMELLRPYQEAEHVIRGMMSIYTHLYDITITERATHVAGQNPGERPANSVEVWHPEVRLFEVRDNKTGAHLGSFYLDIFPRSTKRGGAWVQPIHYGTPAHDGKPHSPHLALLAGNLSAPGKDAPALFSHRDVETIFHEFGHMMHVMLGDTELRSHCGTSVAWDFVELPSQMNENWTWEPEGIATYAVHYKTGQPIPEDYVRKMQDVRFFFPAHDNMGQLCIAKLDLELHKNCEKYCLLGDLDSITTKILAPWRTPMTVQPPSIMRNLTHCISGGYSAAYYSYKWAEVLAADVYTKFQKNGILNPSIGAAYRREILSKGDSKPAAELYRNFMGRDPNPDALLQKQGLMK